MRLKQVMGSPQSKAKTAPTVSFGYYNGRIYFNAPSVELLNLKEGQSIALFQDEDNPTDWYFTISKAQGSLKLKNIGNALVTFNSGIARCVLNSVSLHDSTNFFIEPERVEIEGVSYWKILTCKIVK
jgi:hypothetical protein